MEDIRDKSHLSRTMDQIVRLVLLLLVFVMFTLSVVQLSEWYPVQVIHSWGSELNRLAVELGFPSAFLYYGNILSGLLLLFAGCYCAYRVLCLFGLFKTDNKSPYGDFLLVAILGLIAYALPFLSFCFEHYNYRIKPTAYLNIFLFVFFVLTLLSASLYVISRKKGKEEPHE